MNKKDEIPGLWNVEVFYKNTPPTGFAMNADHFIKWRAFFFTFAPPGSRYRATWAPLE